MPTSKKNPNRLPDLPARQFKFTANAARVPQNEIPLPHRNTHEKKLEERTRRHPFAASGRSPEPRPVAGAVRLSLWRAGRPSSRLAPGRARATKLRLSDQYAFGVGACWSVVGSSARFAVCQVQ
ncbi:unnamed protein product [Colias eurytheme]|nr:unnamed protein product [Colias eurytheme]